jgi:monoamine oxidase
MGKEMDRRKFIKSAATGAGLTAITGSTITTLAATKSANANTDFHYDTIVIGGGFAGVTAARDASHQGLKTLLVEARPRLGGRTFTTNFAGHEIDMGGTWLGWAQPHIWSEVMRYNMTIDESASSNTTRFVWYHKGQRYEGDDYINIMDEAYRKYYAPAREMLPRAYDPLYINDKKLAALDKINAFDAIESLDVSDVQKTLLHSFAGINGHNHSSKSSYLDQLRWISLSGFSPEFMWNNLGRYKIKDGTKKLLDAMQADSNAELKLGTPIKSIEQKNDLVYVTTLRGEILVGHTVIVSLPMNVIPDITFIPELSRVKQEATITGHTGSGTKVYARIKGNHQILMGHGSQDMALNFLWTEYNDEDSQILVGFGIDPKSLDVNDDEAVQSAIRDYIPNAELLESFGYDWNLDPYSKGTWCMYPPGMLTSSLVELQRPEGKVFFAGSDIANGWRGFIDGAIESGSQAAQMVSNQLKQEIKS